MLGVATAPRSVDDPYDNPRNAPPTGGQISVPKNVPLGQHPYMTGNWPMNPVGVASTPDQRMWRNYLNSQLNMQALGFDAQNRQLDFQRNLANIGFGYDQAGMRLNHWADTSRLGQAEWRDVDIARWKNEQDLITAGDRMRHALAVGDRRFDDATTTARRRFGDTEYAAAGARKIDLARLADQLGFADRERGLGMGRAGLQRDATNRALFDDAAARGAATSTGFDAARQELARQFGLDTGGVALAYDRARSAIDSDRAGVDLTFDTTMRNARTNLDGTLRDADTTRFNTRGDSEIAYRDAQVNNTRNRQYIDSVAADYGTTREQMEQSFRLGMSRLGLDFGEVLNSIAAAQSSNNAQKQAAAAALSQQILMAAQGGV